MGQLHATRWSSVCVGQPDCRLRLTEAKQESDYRGMTDLMSLAPLLFGTIGMVTGVTGLIISLLNYRRDRANVDVQFWWTGSKPGKRSGMIVVSNIGRRPAYIANVYIVLPKGREHGMVEVPDPRLGFDFDAMKPPGLKIAEGDAPVCFIFEQEWLQQYKDDWHLLRAAAVDVHRNEYVSSRLKKKELRKLTQAGSG
jgi:hypothetical protein